AVSSAKLSAVSSEIAAAISMETTTAEPARAAAIPVTTKMPAPMIAPTPMAVASSRPSVGFRPGRGPLVIGPCRSSTLSLSRVDLLGRAQEADDVLPAEHAHDLTVHHDGKLADAVTVHLREPRPQLRVRACRLHSNGRDHGLLGGGGGPLGPRDLHEMVERQQAEDRLVALDQEAAPATGQDVLVHQLLKGGPGGNGDEIAAHRLGDRVTRQQIVQDHLLRLGDGGALQEPADER